MSIIPQKFSKKVLGFNVRGDLDFEKTGGTLYDAMGLV
jgi:hypothetical protein